MALVFVLTAFLSFPAHLRSFLRTSNHCRFSMSVNSNKLLGIMIKFKHNDPRYCNLFEASNITAVFCEMLQLFKYKGLFKRKQKKRKQKTKKPSTIYILQA